MKYAILGYRNTVMRVFDTPPSVPHIEISDEIAKTVKDGFAAEPRIIYHFEDGELLTTQQKLDSLKPVVTEQVAVPERLDQLLQGNLSPQALNGLWLVFDASIAQRLNDAQPVYQHQAAPITLIDGRFAVGADLLTEVNGLYAATFAALDQSAFPAVQVLAHEAVAPLIPTPSISEE
jgi:hypothetical protein